MKLKEILSIEKETIEILMRMVRKEDENSAQAAKVVFQHINDYKASLDRWQEKKGK